MSGFLGIGVHDYGVARFSHRLSHGLNDEHAILVRVLRVAGSQSLKKEIKKSRRLDRPVVRRLRGRAPECSCRDHEGGGS